MNFEINIFWQYTEGQLPWTSLFLEVLEVATRPGIHRRYFIEESLLGQSLLQKLQQTVSGRVTS